MTDDFYGLKNFKGDASELRGALKRIIADQTISLVPAICADADSTNEDPFAESAEDVAAEETRDKVDLFEWADSVLGLSDAEFELAGC